MTTIIGIDAAAKAKNVGLARGRYDAGEVVVERVALGSRVESVAGTVVSWISGPTVIAIDAPLGWPAGMGRELNVHRAGEPIGATADEMFARQTDHNVRAMTGRKPLEVGANLIARAALAALNLTVEIRERAGTSLPLLWEPGRSDRGIIEVYPAATMIGRGLSTDDYKKRDDVGLAARRSLVELLRSEATLEVEPEAVAAVDHTLDAVVCILAAADFLRGDVVAPPVEEAETVRREGWIWFKTPGA